MDPLSALGLASSIFQVIDFSWKLVSKSTSLYKATDGALVVNRDLEIISRDLKQEATRLQLSIIASADYSRSAGPDEQALLNLCNAIKLLRRNCSRHWMSSKFKASTGNGRAVARRSKASGAKGRWMARKTIRGLQGGAEYKCASLSQVRRGLSDHH